jgi:hypothetical protein
MVQRPSSQRLTKKRLVFWSAIACGLLASVVLPLREKGPGPVAAVAVAPVSSDPEARDAVGAYLEFIQSYNYVDSSCHRIRDLDGAEQLDGIARRIDQEKRALRTLDLLGVNHERHRRHLEQLADELIAAWGRISEALRDTGTTAASRQAALVQPLAEARAALGQAARRLSLSRPDLEAQQRAPHESPENRAAKLKTFDTILTESTSREARSEQAALSAGGSGAP